MAFTISPKLRAYLDYLPDPTFEDNIPYMYIDTTGNVTVGVGHNLTSHGDCQLLPFVVQRLTRKAVLGGDQGRPIGDPKKIGRPATKDEKQNDYDFLENHDGLGKYAPEQLALYTTLELNSSDIDQLFEKDLQDAIAVARNTFSRAFDSYSVPRQAALIDIAFNCGSFGTMLPLVNAVRGEGLYAKKTSSERWKAAALHSNRTAVSAFRNRQIADWLIDGAAD